MDTFDHSLDISGASNKYLANPVGIEWFGYFKPPTLGYYTFNFKVGQGHCAVWFDDNALFEYTDKNLYLTGPAVIPMKVQITEPKYYAIRIQYFADAGVNLSSEQRHFELSILDNDTSKPINTNEVLYTINNNTYYPPLLYCSFLSTSVQEFTLGAFQCYVCNTADTKTGDPSDFLNIIQTHKFDLNAGKFDYDRGTPGQTNYGSLPDGTNYTDVYTNSSKYPSAFSVYRINVDPRMGNTYQIDTRNGEPYKVNAMDSKLLVLADNYSQKDHYYPNTTNGFQTDPESCKSQCNSSQKCNYYFTYTSNGTPQCVVDTTNSIPTFTQIRPSGSTLQSIVDASSSSLFMRNFELHPPPCSITGPVSVQPVVDTTNYGSAFPYAKYDLNMTPITDLSFVGICGDVSYQTITQGAYDILFNNTMYKSDGSWENPFGFWTNTIKSIENFDTTPAPTKFTNALRDTHDLANTELDNARTYARLQQQINQNYNVLGSKDIPEYLKTRDIMSNNVNYDYNGNVLLYYRNQPIPNIRQQNIMDSKEGYQTQNSLYILGTLTAATLLVLAIIIGKE
jgi:hypothetical protein